MARRLSENAELPSSLPISSGSPRWTLNKLLGFSVLKRMSRKCFGSNVTLAIRSVAASWPQEVYCPPCRSGFRRSTPVPMPPKHAFVHPMIDAAKTLRNPHLNTVRGIPNAPLSISCLRLSSTVTCAPTKSASSRNRGSAPGGRPFCGGVPVLRAASRGLRAHPLHEMSEGASVGILSILSISISFPPFRSPRSALALQDRNAYNLLS